MEKCKALTGSAVKGLMTKSIHSSLDPHNNNNNSNNNNNAKRPTEHIIGHFGDDFYRPDDQSNSVKALK